jgi:hypothetical protein
MQGKRDNIKNIKTSKKVHQTTEKNEKYFDVYFVFTNL